jgi:hypothetical protein
MTGPESRLRAAYAARAADAPSTPHPTPEAIAAAVERYGAEVERLAVLDHIASCARCRSEFELLRATHTAARQLVPATWRVQGLGLAAAAAVVVAVALAVARTGTGHLTTAVPDRGSMRTDAPHTITLIAPIGSAASTAPRFMWHRVPTGESYHFEVLDDSGGVVVRADTRDTTFTAASLTPGRAYRWWVQAKVEGETWQSEFAAIRVLHSGP